MPWKRSEEHEAWADNLREQFKAEVFKEKVAMLEAKCVIDWLLFGSQSEQNAITEAVDELQEIHPEIVENFEVGGVKAWYSDVYSQGAFALLKPYEIENVVFRLMRPYPKEDPQIYFAGEAISFTNGWIQGALESGLRAAYQFYARNEEKHGDHHHQ